VNALYQRLKELDTDSFERLCFHLLKERHPTANVRRVEGAGGDEGVDSFLGELTSGSVVWQSKVFPNGVKNPQREQIRRSLKTAVDKIRPAIWVLCLSVDMDIRAHQWFEKLTKSYAARVAIGLCQASDIVAELMHRKALRECFFPGAALDIAEIRAMLLRTNKATDDELSKIAMEDAEQLIERLKTRDARFNYELVVSPEGGILRKPASDVAFSISKGTLTVNAFPRDVEALRSDPPKLQVTFKGLGRENFWNGSRLGKDNPFSRLRWRMSRQLIHFWILRTAQG